MDRFPGRLRRLRRAAHRFRLLRDDPGRIGGPDGQLRRRAMEWFEGFLVKYPELALFLVISLGAWLGSIKFGGFGLGPVTGSLFAGVLVGQFAHVPVSGMAK